MRRRCGIRPDNNCFGAVRGVVFLFCFWQVTSSDDVLYMEDRDTIPRADAIRAVDKDPLYTDASPVTIGQHLDRYRS